MKRLICDIQKTRRYYHHPVRPRRGFKTPISVGVAVAVFLGVATANIQRAASPSGQPVVVPIAELAQAQTSPFAELKQSLESELSKVLEEIKQYQGEITTLRRAKRTLQNEIAGLEKSIKKTELEVKAAELAIRGLERRIYETQRSVEATRAKIGRSRSFLTEALRVVHRTQQKTFLEVFLANERLSDYFSQIVYLNKIQERIQEEIDELKQLTETLQKQEAALNEQADEQQALLAIAQVKRQELQELRGDKATLLGETKGKEENFQKLLADSEKTAAQIRAQIYQLAGGAGDITFGDAFKLAEMAGSLAGIRPAFLLAILHYESRIGKNTGRCHYKKAAKPSEQPLFEKITKELGLDPDKMLVSCAQSYGYGGAMGAAQFIPSTWLGYKDRVAKITGNNPPSPWNLADAFVAAAVKLADAGATQKSYQAEWKAAMMYLAGGNWKKPSLSFYGNDVMKISERYQRDIETLTRG